MFAEYSQRPACTAINQCIYCGITKDLTDEHIIPYGLLGTSYLPKASCKKCAKITGDFERIVQREFLGSFRVSHDFPSRNKRKKKRPESLPITVNEKKIQLPLSEYPATLILLDFAEPSYFSGNLMGKVISYSKWIDVNRVWNLAEKMLLDSMDIEG
ncbi:MAG: hypothetical protein SFU83_03510 [Meiothermus sp.]|nr:hypothetical protein [Meiothermus sp.]